jgi:DNA polymerase III gamma/tau subunit
MAHVLKDRNAYAPYDINPRVIVIDECDLLLDSDLEKKVVEVI